MKALFECTSTSSWKFSVLFLRSLISFVQISHILSCALPKLGTVDIEIKVPSVENPELTSRMLRATTIYIYKLWETGRNVYGFFRGHGHHLEPSEKGRASWTKHMLRSWVCRFILYAGLSYSKHYAAHFCRAPCPPPPPPPPNTHVFISHLCTLSTPPQLADHRWRFPDYSFQVATYWQQRWSELLQAAHVI